MIVNQRNVGTALMVQVLAFDVAVVSPIMVLAGFLMFRRSANPLVHDLGEKIGCGAHLSQLRRIGSGRFDVAEALPLDKVLALTPNELGARVIPFLKLASME